MVLHTVLALVRRTLAPFLASPGPPVLPPLARATGTSSPGLSSLAPCFLCGQPLTLTRFSRLPGGAWVGLALPAWGVWCRGRSCALPRPLCLVCDTALRAPLPTVWGSPHLLYTVLVHCPRVLATRPLFYFGWQRRKNIPAASGGFAGISITFNK